MAGLKVSVEDRLDAHDLLARYCLLLDEGDEQGWLDLWEEDGVFVGTRPEPVRGHDALRSAPAKSLAGGIRHYLTNISCEHGDTRDDMIVRGYNLVICWLNEPRLFANAVVRYHLVRHGDGWKIRSNQVRLQVPPAFPPEALPGGFPIPNDRPSVFPQID